MRKLTFEGRDADVTLPAMIVECAKCGKKFRLDEAKIGPKGAKVRCSQCLTAFVVEGLAPQATDQQPPTVEAFSQAKTTELAVPLIHAPKAPVDSPPATSSPAWPPAPSLSVSPPTASSPASPPASPAPPLELPDLPPRPAANAPGDDPIHEVQTAVYSVPEALRRFQSGSDLDIDAQSDAAAGGGPDGAEAHKATDQAMARQVSDDLPLADADLIEDMSAQKEEAARVGMRPGASDWTPDGSVPVDATAAQASSPPGDGGEAFVDPFAGRDFQPTGGITAGAPEEGPTSADDEERTRPAQIARIEPVKPGSARAYTVAAASAQQTSPGTFSLGVQSLMYVAIVGVGLAGVVLYLGGGRLDLSVIGIGESSGHPTELAGYQEVYPASLRSVLYSTITGEDMLVFVGTAENRSSEPRSEIDVVAELRDSTGRVVASNSAPLGLPLSPADLVSIDDPESVSQAFHVRARARGEPTVAAGATAPFTVVLLQPPGGLADLVHTVRLEKGAAVLPPPPPAVEPEPVLRKGKRKRKGKRRKGKRKAKAQ